MADARLAEHDPAWGERFRAEAPRLAEALGELVVEIDHIGSTAVPGLPAKPTIDIAVGATTIDVPSAAVERMARLGYEDAGAGGRPGERRFRKGGAFPRELLVHVVEWGGPRWGEYLGFRDALLRSPEVAREYGGLKRRLLARLGGWYSAEDKDAFVRRVLAESPERAFVRSTSPEATERAGARLAEVLRPGDVVTVSGDLGAGKTTFVRGACRALGIEGPVTSPSYTVGHVYRARVRVSHLDLYRFRGLSPAEWGDLEPYFDDAVVFVEWPEAGAGALPDLRVAVTVRNAGSARLIDFESAEKSLLKRVFHEC